MPLWVYLLHSPELILNEGQPRRSKKVEKKKKKEKTKASKVGESTLALPAGSCWGRTRRRDFARIHAAPLAIYTWVISFSKSDGFTHPTMTFKVGSVQVNFCRDTLVTSGFRKREMKRYEKKEVFCDGFKCQSVCGMSVFGYVPIIGEIVLICNYSFKINNHPCYNTVRYKNQIF